MERLKWTDEQWGFEVPVLVALTFMYCDQPGRAEELFNKGIAECESKGWRGAHLSFTYVYDSYGCDSQCWEIKRGSLTRQGVLRAPFSALVHSPEQA